MRLLDVLTPMQLERVKAALAKPALYGPDIDVRDYLLAEGPAAEVEVDEERIREVGIDLERAKRTGYFMQIDSESVRYMSRLPGVEVMSIEEALEREPEVSRLIWKLVDPAADKYTAVAALRGRGGYFVRVKKGVKMEEPVQTCLFMVKGGLQAPHNIIYVEEGAHARVLTGCTIMPESFGLHAGITEVYLERGARLDYVMIHAWSRGTHVRPRTGVLAGEGAEVVTYYINLSTVRTLQTYPRYILRDGARLHSVSLILGRGSSIIDVGAKAALGGRRAAAEILSRVVARDSSKVVARARVEGAFGRGHVECKGLVLSDVARVEAVPELGAVGRGVTLTHEASIGKLSEEAIAYLMSKGFSREEAESILVRGFMNVELVDLGPQLTAYVRNLMNLLARAAI